MIKINVRPNTASQSLFSTFRPYRKENLIAVAQSPNTINTTCPNLFSIKAKKPIKSSSRVWTQRAKKTPHQASLMTLKSSLLRKKEKGKSIDKPPLKHVAFDNFIKELLQRSNKKLKKFPTLKHLLTQLKGKLAYKANNSVSGGLSRRNNRSVANIKRLPYPKKCFSQVDSIKTASVIKEKETVRTNKKEREAMIFNNTIIKERINPLIEVNISAKESKKSINMQTESKFLKKRMNVHRRIIIPRIELKVNNKLSALTQVESQRDNESIL